MTELLGRFLMKSYVRRRVNFGNNTFDGIVHVYGSYVEWSFTQYEMIYSSMVMEQELDLKLQKRKNWENVNGKSSTTKDEMESLGLVRFAMER